ncbi:heme exporter protein CcmD [Rhizorhabdus dicambivorans]|uniref:Heme exporter protein D n=1 Tax=Rhizorhabdus dicambivorans TaxID=1850238 RepID=A0A2A4G1R2_9SPHN|nr:heme exporter protein CcmD [Rhizorhabdus dicambivorans]ATE66573.1 heme exporter protein CcmD [Rhizorhabdus dicambivorans]PCE43943.1 heme exporter protein CcmD [Rhizorhabdus dicambivorans]
MNHWPFIVAAYALTIIGTIGVVALSFVRMRRAERQADALNRRD